MSAIDEDIRDAIDQLFDRIAHMSDQELLALRAAWDEGDEAERRTSWQTVKAAVAATGRQKLLDEASTRFATWGTTDLLGYFGVATLPSHGSGLAPALVRKAALPPVMDAIGALVAFDRLDQGEREVLQSPLSRVAPDWPSATNET